MCQQTRISTHDICIPFMVIKLMISVPIAENDIRMAVHIMIYVLATENWYMSKG